MRNVNNPRARTILKTSLFLVLFFGRPYGAESSCALPAKLSRMVAARWSGWNIVQVNDLTTDDQRLWRKNQGSACPGVVSGHFVTSDKLSYAFSLVDKSKNEQQVIVAIPTKDRTFKMQILAAPSKVSRVSVIHVLPPGKYKEVERGRTLRTKLDSIAYETIEAGEAMYYEEGGSFHSLVLSE